MFKTSRRVTYRPKINSVLGTFETEDKEFIFNELMKSDIPLPKVAELCDISENTIRRFLLIGEIRPHLLRRIGDVLGIEINLEKDDW
jgi:hypothetical protein